MKDEKELPKTYGEKPASFMFAFDDEPAEKYYIGSEVSPPTSNRRRFRLPLTSAACFSR